MEKDQSQRAWLGRLPQQAKQGVMRPGTRATAQAVGRGEMAQQEMSAASRAGCPPGCKCWGEGRDGRLFLEFLA